MKPLAAPPAAVAVFAAATDRAALYAGWLAGPGVERGLLGPREVPRLWERHLLNCAALLSPLAEALPVGRPGSGDRAQVCDLGSGAGLPGIVVALLRPDLDVVLLEPLLRRASFLSEVVAALELPHTTVLRARAEEVVGTVEVDVVVARAVAPLERLAGWSVPLLRPGGQLLALKGERATAELAQAGAALDRLGIAPGRRAVLTVGTAEQVTKVVRLVRDRASGPAADRRVHGS